MHMADVLVSPAVGAVMGAVSAGSVCGAAYNLKKTSLDERKLPLMGVMGAVVFAGQMINFTIPGTGSSGHICGGILLAALIGPNAALISMAAVLLIQCLLFADGGLIAYGCNLFNIGVCGAVIAHCLIYRPIIKRHMNRRGIIAATILGSIVGLQLGALGVTVQTYISGVTKLPLGAFLTAMQPIHLAIGLVEGIVSAMVLCFIYEARPELLTLPAKTSENTDKVKGALAYKKAAVVFACIAIVIAGGFSLIASKYPDGLEWSIEKTIADAAEYENVQGDKNSLSDIVSANAPMPEYRFGESLGQNGESWRTSVAGIIGTLTVLIISIAIAVLIRIFGKKL